MIIIETHLVLIIVNSSIEKLLSKLWTALKTIQLIIELTLIHRNCVYVWYYRVMIRLIKLSKKLINFLQYFMKVCDILGNY